MEWLALLVIAAIVLLIFALKTRQPSGQFAEFPYTKNDVLFTPAERSFLGVLEQAVADQYRVFGKVRVADVLSVKPMPNRTDWQRAFNRISAKHFDFVLCRHDDMGIVGVIELNDRSHKKSKRQVRDDFLTGLCHATGLLLIQVPAQPAYSVSDIRTKVLSAGNLGEATPADSATAADSNEPLCPKCSAPMVRRTAKSGANAGREFWGCSAFPKCRGIRPIINQSGAAADADPSRD